MRFVSNIFSGGSVGSGSPGASATRPESLDEEASRKNVIFVVVSVALLMASIDQTIVATALTAIQGDLHAQLTWSSWTITIYSLVQIIVMPLAGKISDQYGRKNVFLAAATVFTVASLCCSLAGDIYVLVVFRALQALGGGAFMPCATGLVADHFGKDRDRAIGLFTSIFPIGAIIGPIIGGVIVTYWSWRVIFLVNIPIGVVLILLGAKFLPASAPKARTGTDVLGAGLLALTILSAMFGISSLGSGHPVDARFVIIEAVAVLLGGLFVHRAKTARAPFIPATLIWGRGFGVMNTINLIFGSAALGMGVLVPLYAEQRYGIEPSQAGSLLSARAVGMICIAGLAAFALRRTGYRAPMLAGFVVIGLGMASMAISPPGLSHYAWLSIAAGITGLGMGAAVPASNNAILQLAGDQIAATAGLRGMFRQSGGIIAVSVASAIVTQSSHPGITLSHVFLVFGAMVLCAIPLIWLVPDHRGTW